MYEGGEREGIRKDLREMREMREGGKGGGGLVVSQGERERVGKGGGIRGFRQRLKVTTLCLFHPRGCFGFWVWEG